MSMRATCANLAWMASCLRDWKRFRHALRNPAAAQARVLGEILSNMKGSATLPGRFEDLPPRGWSEIDPLVKRAAEGETGVFGLLPVKRFVPTSGSDAGTKWIPYNSLLERQFQRGIRAWVYDLYRNRPQLIRGTAYWSISPAVPVTELKSGIPVGFDTDSAYLGGVGKRIVEHTFAVPDAIAQVKPEDFRRTTLLFLLARPDLSLISVWSPTFLLQLMNYFSSHREALLSDLRGGVNILGRTLRAHPVNDPWRRLILISCWTDGSAGDYVEQIRKDFPGVEIQGKGLVATEAFVSLPFAGHHPLAVTSHYLEFEQSDGRLLRTEELREGDEAVVVVTTGGGLIRYRLNDRIAVTGFLHGTPCIRFMGRHGKVSDRYGEKLCESFVRRVLDQLDVRGFSMLAPDGEGYTLFAETPPGRERLENALQGNIHYKWAVSSGQMRGVRVCGVGRDAFDVYQARCMKRGQKLGDIKPCALDLGDGWQADFGMDGLENHS